MLTIINEDVTISTEAWSQNSREYTKSQATNWPDLKLISKVNKWDHMYTYVWKSWYNGDKGGCHTQDHIGEILMEHEMKTSRVDL